MSQESYIAFLEEQRAEKDYFFVHDPYSPLVPEERHDFAGLNYYPPDPSYQYTLDLQYAEPDPVTFQTSTGAQQHFHRIGVITFEVEGQPAQLAIYRSDDHGELFLPFRDATSGKETYGAGRYLDPVDLGKDRLLVDFNLAYNPYCAYSPDFSCPLPPIENWLKMPIRAGEKNYKEE
ncbi:MAG: DUF1684 domain-containing protein [Ardenticatenaceae bacterium]